MRTIEEAWRCLSCHDINPHSTIRHITLDELRSIVEEQVDDWAIDLRTLKDDFLELHGEMVEERQKREAAERERDNYCVRLDNALRELVAHREKQHGNYWAWQGDGHDHLESIVAVCPVVISASKLQEIITAREAAEKACKAKDDALQFIGGKTDHGHNDEPCPICLAVDNAMGDDCGKDYVRKYEADSAIKQLQNELIEANRYSSEVRKIADSEHQKKITPLVEALEGKTWMKYLEQSGNYDSYGGDCDCASCCRTRDLFPRWQVKEALEHARNILKK